MLETHIWDSGRHIEDSESHNGYLGNHIGDLGCYILETQEAGIDNPNWSQKTVLELKSN